MDLQINKYTKRQKRDQPLYGGADIHSLFRNFQLLEEKLNYAQKQLSAWDFLQIAQVIGNDEEYQVKLNLLLPNTSAIVTKKLSNADPGDIFFKNTDYSIQHISAERGGIYYPQQIVQIPNTRTYQLIYQFLPSEPTLNSSSTNIGDIADPAQNMTFQIIDGAEALTYSERIEVEIGGSHLDSVTSDSREISGVVPVIKGFTGNDEEVYWDLVYTTDQDGFFMIGNEHHPIPLIVNYIVLK